MSTLFPTDPRRRCRATTIEIIAVGIIVILAMWTTVAASITIAAFLSFQIRVVAGLRVLAGAA